LTNGKSLLRLQLLAVLVRLSNEMLGFRIYR